MLFMVRTERELVVGMAAKGLFPTFPFLSTLFSITQPNNMQIRLKLILLEFSGCVYIYQYIYINRYIYEWRHKHIPSGNKESETNELRIVESFDQIQMDSL